LAAILEHDDEVRAAAQVLDDRIGDRCEPASGGASRSDAIGDRDSVLDDTDARINVRPFVTGIPAQ
jgi:hypothetical protein